MIGLKVKPGGRVLIGGNIWLKNLGAHSVRIGIDAPPEVHVMREELLVGGVSGTQKHMDRLAARKAG